MLTHIFKTANGNKIEVQDGTNITAIKADEKIHLNPEELREFIGLLLHIQAKSNKR